MRIRLVLGAMLACFLLLVGALWRIQVARGQEYQKNLVRQSVRRIRIPGMRGRIFDRQGRILADDAPSYCLAIYLEELRRPGPWKKTVDRVMELIEKLSGILELPPQLSRRDVERHIHRRLPLPLIAWRNLDERAMARWAERGLFIPGADIYTEATRRYPYGRSACHVLGYVGRASPAGDDGGYYHYYLPEMEGRAGVEKHFDELLRGRAGGRLVRVDVAGFRHDDLGFRAPQAGADLKLALDVEIQQAAEEALGESDGAVVILDPRNGDVLALASSPGFDPNGFVPAISSADWARLIGNPHKPLMNRALAGRYAPGSTFKPVVALAALENGRASPSTRFNCPGYFMVGKHRFLCWYTRGHGMLDMRGALEHSCNVYFYQLGLKCGYPAIFHMAAALGLGRRTGIALDYERAGLLPDDAWKRRVYGDAWRDGDTCNASIGQGPILVTPLQMAVVVAAIANGGRVYRPRLLLGVRKPGSKTFETVAPEMVNDLHFSRRALSVVREGMYAVVMSATGTGRRARVPGLEIAGKTGTAEYGRKGSGLKYGWMIAYAPYRNPRYAVAMVIERAQSGGATTAPRIALLFKRIFGIGGTDDV